jgi:hypothetical protein
MHATEHRNFPQPFAVSLQGEGVSYRTRRETDMRVLTVATLAALFVAGFAIPADAARPVKGAVQGTATAAKGVGHGAAQAGRGVARGTVTAARGVGHGAVCLFTLGTRCR